MFLDKWRKDTDTGIYCDCNSWSKERFPLPNMLKIGYLSIGLFCLLMNHHCRIIGSVRWVCLKHLFNFTILLTTAFQKCNICQESQIQPIQVCRCLTFTNKAFHNSWINIVISSMLFNQLNA